MPPLLQGIWDGNCVEDDRFSVYQEFRLGQGLPSSWGLSCSPWGWSSWDPYFWETMKVRHSAATDKFIFITGNELDKVMEGNVSPSIKGGRVHVTIKAAGDNLVLSTVQDALEGALRCPLYHLLLCCPIWQLPPNGRSCPRPTHCG